MASKLNICMCSNYKDGLGKVPERMVDRSIEVIFVLKIEPLHRYSSKFPVYAHNLQEAHRYRFMQLN